MCDAHASCCLGFNTEHTQSIWHILWSKRREFHVKPYSLRSRQKWGKKIPIDKRAQDYVMHMLAVVWASIQNTLSRYGIFCRAKGENFHVKPHFLRSTTKKEKKISIDKRAQDYVMHMLAVVWASIQNRLSRYGIFCGAKEENFHVKPYSLRSRQKRKKSQLMTQQKIF